MSPNIFNLKLNNYTCTNSEMLDFVDYHTSTSNRCLKINNINFQVNKTLMLQWCKMVVIHDSIQQI